MLRIERIYKRIMKVFPELQNMEAGTGRKIENGSYMPLSLDILNVDHDVQIIALAHNSIQNGDVMADPDMQIRINHKLKSAQAMTFQNDFMGFYQESIFMGEDGKMKIRPKLMKEHSAFLDQWTKNIIDQGFAEVGK